MDRDVSILKPFVVTGQLALRRVEDPVVPTPTSLARNVRVEDWGRDADRCGGSAEEVAHIVGYAVEVVGSVLKGTRQLRWGEISEDFVHEDKVMGWASGTLECGVRLQIKVPVFFCIHNFGIYDLDLDLVYYIVS